MLRDREETCRDATDGKTSSRSRVLIERRVLVSDVGLGSA